MATPNEYEGCPLLEEFRIFVQQQLMRVLLYQSPHRPQGRRIVVKDEADKTQFDSFHHVDLANALSAFWSWMEGSAGHSLDQT